MNETPLQFSLSFLCFGGTALRGRCLSPRSMFSIVDSYWVLAEGQSAEVLATRFNCDNKEHQIIS